MARAPSRVDVSRNPGETTGSRRTGTEAGSLRRTGSRVSAEVPEDVEPSRPSRASLAVSPRPYDDEDDPERTMLPPPPEPEPAPAPVRRRTGMSQSAVSVGESGVRRRTSSRVELSEQGPPRRRTPPEQREDSDANLPPARRPAPVQAPEGGLLPQLKKMMGVFVVLGLVGLVIIFRQPIMEKLNSSAMDGQGILLNVTSNQRVQVSVRHSQRCHASEPITVLGWTPLERMGGAHVQDTVILENKERGIEAVIELPFGEPQEIKTIERDFQMGFFRPKLTPPRAAQGIEIFFAGQKIGLYQSGLRLEMVEGKHNLVLQGPSLKEPVPLEVEIKARGVTDLTVDLTPYLAQ